MEFINSNLPLILFFLAGFGLLITEALMPGFGIAGILGIIAEVLAIWIAWTHYGTAFALCLTAVILLLTGVTVFLSFRSIMKGRLSRSELVLRETESPAESGSEALAGYVGREGVTVTPLRPAGQINLDGVRVSAASGGEFLEKGRKVRVNGIVGDHVTVVPVEVE